MKGEILSQILLHLIYNHIVKTYSANSYFSGPLFSAFYSPAFLLYLFD